MFNPTHRPQFDKSEPNVVPVLIAISDLFDRKIGTLLKPILILSVVLVLIRYMVCVIVW